MSILFIDLVQSGWRYATGLRELLSVTTDRAEAERLLTSQFQNREETFLQVLERGIYGNPRSPYRRLLLHAGFQFEDVKSLVKDAGLTEALERLYDAGVYVTLEEFKGRMPVKRPGLEFPVSATDFNNPLLRVHYLGGTGGSRGAATRVPIDFDLIAHETASFLISLHASGVADRPAIIWSEGPPGALGLKWSLMFARIGRKIKWFTPVKPTWNRQGIQGRLMMAYHVVASKLFRQQLAWPKYEPEARQIVKHMADAVKRGAPALVLGTPSQWVRLCLAAEEAKLDIRGTAFWGGGEPFTPGKAEVVERAGAWAITSYAMGEAGAIGHVCGASTGPDDMHFLKDKLAIITHPKHLDSGLDVDTVAYTSLLTSASKIMLNVESGDYATFDERDCGCLWRQLGFTTHISNVRSYEKLTSESVMFTASMLDELLEKTLPSRFGGGPTDYQLVEQEEGGLPRVSVIVSPRVGAVDEQAVRETVLESVQFADWSRRMGEMWRRAGTLRVLRREPYTTDRGKILPLHVLGLGAPRDHAQAPEEVTTADPPPVS
jgi:hypothetical protein